MDSSNFNAYKSGRAHRYHGGLAKVSPFRIVVPSTGSWYLTVDLAGLRATNVRIGVSIEQALPASRGSQSAPLTEIQHERPSAVTPDDDGQTWDVFVSHASEDKDAVALPLAEALTAHGLRVWLDKSELRIGDSLRRKIDHGLAHSAFGVVIFSKSFFAKGWPQYELDGIVALSTSGKQRLLPIWHEITKDEILRQSPSSADKIARNTAITTIDEIATEIVEVVREE